MEKLAELWRALSARKIVQWGLAYLGAAWFLTELFGELADTWGWPTVTLQALQVALLLGLPIALLLAWYHGEKGRQRVSGPELIMIGLLLAVVAGAVRAVLSGDSRSQGEPTEAATETDSDIRIAVLPLEAGPSADDAWLASGLRAELINEFASIPSLLVVGRSGVGEGLAVDYLVEGEVRRSREAVRLSIRLVSADDGSVVESVAEDRVLELDSLFAFQAEAARRVVGRIGGQLRAVRSTRDGGGEPEPEAFRLFLQAARSGWTLTEFQQRERLLRRALELDPDFVAAAAALVRVTNWMEWNFSTEIPDARERATDALGRLRALGGDDIESLRAEADYAYRVASDLPGALDLLESVRQQDPGDAEALLLGGAILRRMGRWEEALAWMSQGFEVDPYGGVAWSLGETHQMLRNWPEAERYYSHAVAADPNNPFAQSTLAFLPIHAEGDTASTRRYLETLNEPLRQEIEGPLYRYAGRMAVAARHLDSHPSAGTGSSIGKANRLATLGILAAAMRDGPEAEAWADSLLAFMRGVAWNDRPLTRSNVRSLQALALALRGEHDEALRASIAAIQLYPPSRDAYVAGRLDFAVARHPHILLLTGDTIGAARALADLLSVPSGFSPWNVSLDPLWAGPARLEPLASLLPIR